MSSNHDRFKKAVLKQLYFLSILLLRSGKDKSYTNCPFQTMW